MIEKSTNKADPQTIADWKRFWSLVFAMALRTMEEAAEENCSDSKREAFRVQDGSQPQTAE